MADTSRRVGSIFIAAVLIAGTFFIGSSVIGWSPFKSLRGEPYSQVGTTVVDSVRRLAALTTVEMVEYTTVEKGNDFGWLNWARGDRLFLFAVARIGAGIDLDRLYDDSFEVDEDSGAVTVKMPPAAITYVSIDNEATQVFDRDTGLLTKGDPQLESDARQVAEEVLVTSALEHGILETAAQNAEATMREFLLGLGYTEVTFVPMEEPQEDS